MAIRQVARGVSLTNVFDTGKGLKRQRTYRRFKIFDQLCRKEDMRKNRLMYAVNGDVSVDLEVLAKSGMVVCTIEGVEEEIITNQRFTGTDLEFAKLPSVEKAVATGLREGKSSIYTLQRDLVYAVPTIIGALCRLQEKGYTEIRGRFLNTRKFTINITEAGRELWETFLLPLENRLGMDRNQLRRDFEEVDEKSVQAAMKVYARSMPEIELWETL